MHTRLIAFSLAALTASKLLGGVVTVVFDGNTYTHPTATSAPVQFSGASTPDITIDLGAVTTTKTIRIFDSATAGFSTDPTAGMGKLTLLGSASATGRVNLLIADGDQVPFPTNSSELNDLRPGLTTFGGNSAALLPGQPPTANTFTDQGDTFHDYDQDPWPTGGVAPTLNLL